MLRAVLVALLLALPARANGQGDPAAAYVAEGEKLAKAGFFAESIARFKEAEAVRPRAVNDCLIALSYLRLEKLGQAEMFASRCAARASTGDPAPEWLAAMQRDITAGLRSAEVAPVEIRVTPATARLTCSAFAADESFAAGTVYQPVGKHTIRAEADGHRQVAGEVEVVDRTGRRIELTLTPAADAPTVASTPPLEAGSIDRSPPGRGPWPWVVLGVSGASLIGGVAFHVKALDTKERAESSLARYNELVSSYESQRTITYTLYTVAAITGAIGAYLALRDPPEQGGGFALGGAAAPDGAMVTIEWWR
jgi:hypothetical protein